MRAASLTLVGLAALLSLDVVISDAWAQQQQRPPAIITDDAQACISVANLTKFNWPITLAREGRQRSTVSVKAQEVMRYCAPDRLKAGEHITVTLRSSWMPLGECKLRNRGTMEIFRVPDKSMDSGERTEVKCYEGR